MRHAQSIAARFKRDTAGNVLPMVAMGILVGAAIVGSAVDISRNYLTREQMQSACDAAVLAGRRTVTTNGFDAASQQAARTYFFANFKDSTQNTHDTVFEVTSHDDGKSVEASASTVLDTVLMKIFGFAKFDIEVSCGSSMGVGNADVIMVLDTTGSMGSSLGNSTRIAALKSAMKNFYVTMTNATADSNARIRYGFVPYSQSVNVGHLIRDLDPRYIADRHTYQSREISDPWVEYSGESEGTWANTSTYYGAESTCKNALNSYNSNFANTGSASAPSVSQTNAGYTQVTVSQGQSKTEYRCNASWVNSRYRYYIQSRSVTRTAYTRRKLVYKAVEYDTSAYKAFSTVQTPTGSDGGMVSSKWAGCILERGTVASSTFTYSSLNGISPSGALDLNLDALPNVGDDRTKWKPLWPEVAFYRTNANGNLQSAATSDYGFQTVSACPAKAQHLSEMTQKAFNDYADSLVATGNTYLDIGMIWGGRLISPQGMFSSIVNKDPENGGEVSRHIIFMTDGIMEPVNWIQSSWGMEYWDRQVTSNGSTDLTARHTQRFLATCEAIKDKGVRIWVIAFTAGLSTDLVTCSTPNSSYLANNAAELNTAFQEIAKQVGELRVIQ